jgi:hypothetical protein
MKNKRKFGIAIVAAFCLVVAACNKPAGETTSQSTQDSTKDTTAVQSDTTQNQADSSSTAK